MNATSKGPRWVSALLAAAITVAVTAGCASTVLSPAGDESSQTPSPAASIDPAAVQSCALLADRANEVGDSVTDAFRVLDADPQDALTRFDEAAASFDAAGDEWVGEAATAAEQLGAGLDDLNVTMKASVDGTTIDVASAEAAANTFTEQARGAMDTCVTAAHQAAS